MEVYIYPMLVQSNVFDKFRRILKCQDFSLAIISNEPICSVPPLMLSHKIFGDVTCSIDTSSIKCRILRDRLEIVSQFFAMIFNSRWNKKKTSNLFQFSKTISGIDRREEYMIGCVDGGGNLLVDYMEGAVEESKRSKDDRIQAARDWCTSKGTKRPRLWSPIYNDKVVYVSHGPSGEVCGDAFTHKSLVNVCTYQDYYQERYDLILAKDCPLFDAQRLWVMPAGMKQSEDENTDAAFMDRLATLPSRASHTLIDELPHVVLPRDAVAEALNADAGMLLLTTFLPQQLYHLERYLCAQSFTGYCCSHLPYLGSLLSTLKVEDIAAALTAPSCADSANYELQEWLGDAVLKMVQTEVLVKSTNLKQWISCFHEGFLSIARSGMGSNKRLEKIAKALGIHRFIQTRPLSRMAWTPSPLARENPSMTLLANGKTCADVVEALLGLVYLERGYASAFKLAEELLCTVPWEERFGHDEVTVEIDADALYAVNSFTGYEFTARSKLLKEALTHPTDITSEVSSYQRLEWVGDAVGKAIIGRV